MPETREGIESRREWLVWLTLPGSEPEQWGGPGVAWPAQVAYDTVEYLHEEYPDATVELEEIEHITRRVERRVVPRPEPR